MQNVKIVKYSTKNAYDYFVPTPGHESANVLGGMVVNDIFYAWYSQEIKVIEIKRRKAGDE